MFVLSFVFLPLLVLLQHLLLEVGPESTVTQGHQGLAVEVGHHLEHGVVVSPVRVVKTVLQLLDESAVRIKSVKVKCILMLDINFIKSYLSDRPYISSGREEVQLKDTEPTTPTTYPSRNH